ncbi:MAG: hypothetical protein ACOH1X_02965 [Kaistella sp.]
MKTFEINYADDTFHIEAKYFNVSESGVIFYDENDRRIGFAPLQSVIKVVNVVED